MDFDQNKIIGAIRKANVSVEEFERASKGDAEAIASCIEDTIESCGHAVGVEEIQDMVQDAVDEALYKAGLHAKQIEGNNQSTWILMDYQDIIVHLFSKEDRLFYDLERIWRDGKIVEL